ncbi:hypothetical protein [Thalassomonas actiniarum]|uniref:Uncharacterized protein n=1 Tax=Thalassomonas actiniarum TaxID=485447 RepID=A0AAF0C5L7_9GAMM|nr:hypothetical protein [Thalassomonas actiniarum]WDE01005.1 hypothetical protein SG35_010435 [Thalassomonas actiniarum]
MSQKLAAKGLKQVTGGSSIDMRVKPAARILNTSDLKKVTGGSGIHKGDDPKISKFAEPAADVQLASTINFFREDDKQLP